MNEKMNKTSDKEASNLSTQKNLYKDFILEEDWINLIDKHKLRYEIWTILKLDNELNVTEISHLVKQSKSTVSRVLIQMETDGLVKSRREKKKKGEGEKIPPKFYRINEEYRTPKASEIAEFEQIDDPIELRKFYSLKIKNLRNAIYNHHKLLDLLTPILSIFEDQLDNIDRAKKINDLYLSGENEPWFNIIYFDRSRYNEFLDIRLEYLLKLEKLAREQEINTENVFAYIDASISLNAIFELKKDMYLK
ncbi:MAG: winged helix-turn-helix domain-containing protein [Candidatus Thorarchaeota archaeon]